VTRRRRAGETTTTGRDPRGRTELRAGSAEGWHGWDDYAAFYDWENRRTVGRRDVPFWREFARDAGGPVLELGCGTGRITLPLARGGVATVGVDRSAEMLAFARRRVRRVADAGRRPSLVRGDIRRLPFADGSFAAVIAPYGILQSLLRDRDLASTLAAVARVLRPGGRFGIDLVPDVPKWREYRRRVSLVGRMGRTGPLVTLIESVRQDTSRRLTIFDHEYIVGWGHQREVRQFTVTFRTLPIAAMVRRLARAGLEVDGRLGGYAGQPLVDESDTWLLTATKASPGQPRAASPRRSRSASASPRPGS
jgi:ubiquinone/menaquinone biosynthesis C-methylase UbiE